jgi:hypothetical protein
MGALSAQYTTNIVSERAHTYKQGYNFENTSPEHNNNYLTHTQIFLQFTEILLIFRRLSVCPLERLHDGAVVLGVRVTAGRMTISALVRANHRAPERAACARPCARVYSQRAAKRVVSDVRVPRTVGVVGRLD